MTLIRPIIVAGVLTLTVTSCRRSAPETTLQPGGFVAVVGVGRDNHLWPILQGTTDQIRAEMGLTIPLRCDAPPVTSVNAQKRMIDQFCDEGMRVLCVQVTDADALDATFDSLAARGIQVVTMMMPPRKSESSVHVGPDDELVGTALADAVIAVTKRRGTVAVLHADSAGVPLARRHRAFNTRMEAAPTIHRLMESDCHQDPIAARTTIRETMTRFPRIRTWAILGNWPLRELGRDQLNIPPTCQIVGVDPIPETWPAFDNGQVAAMVAYDYRGIVERAISTACAAVMGSGGRLIPFAAPPRIVHADDLEAYKNEWKSWTARTPTPP